MANEFEILFVDDEPLIVELAGQALRDLGHSVKLFNESSKALNYFQENHQQIKIIFSDLSMPVMNGIDLCEKCQLIKPVDCVLISGNHNELKNLIGKKDYRILNKPYKKSDLDDIIKDILSKS